MGWFHTSTSPDQPFGNMFPVDVYHDGCTAVFGERYIAFNRSDKEKLINFCLYTSFTAERLNESSSRFNTIYGGLEPEITNAIFVHGEHDPWSVIGRRTDLNEDAVAIVIEGKGILTSILSY